MACQKITSRTEAINQMACSAPAARSVQVLQGLLYPCVDQMLLIIRVSQFALRCIPKFIIGPRRLLLIHLHPRVAGGILGRLLLILLPFSQLCLSFAFLLLL